MFKTKIQGSKFQTMAKELEVFHLFRCSTHTHAQHPRGVGSCLKLRITVFQRKEAAKCEQDMKPKTWIFRTLVSQSKKSAQKSAWRAFVQRSMARFLSVSKMQGDEQMQLTYLLSVRKCRKLNG
jgi:hypothetical protein